MPSKTPAYIEKQIISYYSDGYGTCELSKIFLLNRCTVLEILKRNGITPKRITRPYKNKYDIHFFSSYTYDSCYWAGFIFADGNIHSKKKCLQIGLASKDQCLLHQFKKSIKSSAPLYNDNKGLAKKITISGKWYAEALENNFNVIPQKTFKGTFPKQMPSKYHPDFLRGYFDGDGSIYINKNNIPIIYFTGNVQVISYIRDLCLNYIGVSSDTFARLCPNKTVVQFCLSGKKAFSILKWMYNNSNENTRLNRKYIRYLEAIKKYGEENE